MVLLYMGNEFNALLRPILEKQLKPGSRIISHRFIIGDWEPDETKTIKVTGQDGDEYTHARVDGEEEERQEVVWVRVVECEESCQLSSCQLSVRESSAVKGRVKK